MRPGTLFAAGCVALLAYWKLSEAAYVSASFLFALGVGLAIVGVLPRGRRLGTGPGDAARSPALRPSSPSSSAGAKARASARQPSAEEIGQAQRAHAREIRVWRAIVIAGMAISIAGVFYFPPMSLVVATLALYALYRLRRAAGEGPGLE